MILGNAFDIIGKLMHTGFEQVSDDVERTSYEIEFNNSKYEVQNVTFVEHFDGDWKIIIGRRLSNYICHPSLLFLLFQFLLIGITHLKYKINSISLTTF